jgi:hypothetical protein
MTTVCAICGARLANDGVDVWLDKEKLLPGQNWRNEIRIAVGAADTVVVCRSKEFNPSASAFVPCR